mmetsp:Transcript_80386/g.225949  ORF Transcript_80386/g.225949 Transcript_80386/m.225949 type:complete len:217 (+) Transcript_80386:155-805(+)
MAVCRVTKVEVLAGGTAAPDEGFSFKITLDVAEALKEDAMFRCMYVSDADDDAEGEEELESMDVGNEPGLPQGIMEFMLGAPAPPRCLLEKGGGPLEAAGLYISGIYRGKEFFRVGYFTRHQYDSEELQENPLETADWSRLTRVLSEPITTHFLIPWDGPEKMLNPEGEEDGATGGGEDRPMIWRSRGSTGPDNDEEGGGTELLRGRSRSRSRSPL